MLVMQYKISLKRDEINTTTIKIKWVFQEVAAKNKNKNLSLLITKKREINFEFVVFNQSFTF